MKIYFFIFIYIKKEGLTVSTEMLEFLVDFPKRRSHGRHFDVSQNAAKENF